MAERDEAHMARALELAHRGWGRVSPNPLVGAVVVRDERVVGEGWHEGPGTDHAEVMALRHAGPRSSGATLYCTLEPCNRFGRTPPCTSAIIAAGVARVVVAGIDPNLGDDAPGLAELRASGIDVAAGVLRDPALRANGAFLRHVVTGLPFVVLKMAATLDGKTAAADGSSRWITSEEARGDVQRLRAWSDAIVVGAGTVGIDDPRLTVRDDAFASARPPLRVVVDASGRTPASARVFGAEAPTLVATTNAVPGDRVGAWEEAGAEVLVLDPADGGGVDLPALMQTLGKRDVQGVLLEGGATLAWSFVREGLVDRVVVYVAPRLVGGTGAAGILGGAGIASMGDAIELDALEVARMGPDVRMEADVHRDR